MRRETLTLVELPGLLLCVNSSKCLDETLLKLYPDPVQRPTLAELNDCKWRSVTR